MGMDSYVELGLTAMSRAGSKGFFDGHYGAALLAAYYMQREHRLPEHVQEGLLRTCVAYQAERPEWFQPYTGEEADPALMQQVLDQLGKNLTVLRRSGHGVTFGTLALRALTERPDLCYPSLIAGLVACLEHTVQDRPTRYYGIPNYLDLTPEELGLAPYQSPEEMVQLAFAALDVVVPDGTFEENFYFFTGEVEHGVTFAHALVDLGRLGYEELMQQGMRWHRLQMHLNAQRPDEVLASQVVEPDFESVLSPEYWAKTFRDPHGIKVPYAALDLLASHADRERAERGVCKILTLTK